jgi:DtxR family transcriptional regulator, Mn-dependent transcriptional regulator
MRAVVRRVPDSDRELLRYLDELGLVPGEVVELVVSAPFAGPVTVRARGAEHALARELASLIGVVPE